MRIAFHAPRAAYLKSYASGDTANVKNFVAGLQARGHEVRIVSHVNVRRFWQGRLPLGRAAAEAVRVWRDMKTFAPDAWLVYGAGLIDVDLFGWWQCRGRYVLINARVGRGRRLPAMWRRFFSIVHGRSLRRADSIAADRPAQIEALQEWNVPPERLFLLPSPAGGLGDLPSRTDARVRLALPANAAVILCVTRLPRPGSGAGKTESVLELIRSFSLLPEECMLVIVGGGEGQLQVEDEIRRCSVASRVRLAGEIPHAEVRWFYSACDFYAYPFPGDLPFVAIVEAQAAARPVVVMKTRSTETIVVDGESGLLARDLEQFGRHMAALAADRTRCAAMGRAAAEYVAMFHSIETRIKQVEAMLLGTSPIADQFASPPRPWSAVASRMEVPR